MEAGQVVVVQNLLVTTQQVEKVTGLRWKQPAWVVELLPGLAGTGPEGSGYRCPLTELDCAENCTFV